MKTKKNVHKLTDLLADLEEDTVLEVVHRRIEAGDELIQILEECNEGMRLVANVTNKENTTSPD